MEKNDMLKKIQEIGECENTDDRLTLLTDLSDEVSKDYDRFAELSKSLTETQENLRKSQETNMNYFKRLNEQKANVEIIENQTGMKEEEPKERKSYEDIINDLGKK